jgi:hypothetical protein
VCSLCLEKVWRVNVKHGRDHASLNGKPCRCGLDGCGQPTPPCTLAGAVRWCEVKASLSPNTCVLHMCTCAPLLHTPGTSKAGDQPTQKYTWAGPSSNKNTGRVASGGLTRHYGYNNDPTRARSTHDNLLSSTGFPAERICHDRGSLQIGAHNKDACRLYCTQHWKNVHTS